MASKHIYQCLSIVFISHNQANIHLLLSKLSHLPTQLHLAADALWWIIFSTNPCSQKLPWFEFLLNLFPGIYIVMIAIWYSFFEDNWKSLQKVFGRWYLNFLFFCKLFGSSLKFIMLPCSCSLSYTFALVFGWKQKNQEDSDMLSSILLFLCQSALSPYPWWIMNKILFQLSAPCSSRPNRSILSFCSDPSTLWTHSAKKLLSFSNNCKIDNGEFLWYFSFWNYLQYQWTF